MTRSRPPSIFIVENVTRNRVLASQVQAANDSASRRKGLLEVKDLSPDAGIWINPCEAIHTFGMQINLDVIFLDAKLRVRKIAAHLKPNRIAFCLTARSVLEIKAGTTAVSGLKCGDQLSLRQAERRQPTAAVDSGRRGT